MKARLGEVERGIKTKARGERRTESGSAGGALTPS